MAFLLYHQFSPAGFFHKKNLFYQDFPPAGENLKDQGYPENTRTGYQIPRYMGNKNNIEVQPVVVVVEGVGPVSPDPAHPRSASRSRSTGRESPRGAA